MQKLNHICASNLSLRLCQLYHQFLMPKHVNIPIPHISNGAVCLF